MGATAPAGVGGYGLGFTADAPLAEASAVLRSLGYPTSVVARATAAGRSWRALQVHGLLPDPFPVPATTRPPGLMDRVTEAAGRVLTKVPPLAKAATRKAGRSMVVLTEYDFDAGAWRSAAGHGPEAIAVDVGTGGYDWSKFLLAPSPLELRANGPTEHYPRLLRGRRRVPSAWATLSSSSARRRDGERRGSPERNRATWSARFVMSISDSPR